MDELNRSSKDDDDFIMANIEEWTRLAFQRGVTKPSLGKICETKGFVSDVTDIVSENPGSCSGCSFISRVDSNFQSGCFCSMPEVSEVCVLLKKTLAVNDESAFESSVMIVDGPIPKGEVRIEVARDATGHVTDISIRFTRGTK